MIVQCDKCSVRFDDEFRTTICPHDPFLANDGHNNFALHSDSYISAPTMTDLMVAPESIDDYLGDPQHEANLANWLASEQAEADRE